MRAKRTRKEALLELEAPPPDLRDLSRSCHPRGANKNRPGRLSPPSSWSGSGVGARVASLLCLSSDEAC